MISEARHSGGTQSLLSNSFRIKAVDVNFLMFLCRLIEESRYNQWKTAMILCQWLEWKRYWQLRITKQQCSMKSWATTTTFISFMHLLCLLKSESLRVQLKSCWGSIRLDQMLNNLGNVRIEKIAKFNGKIKFESFLLWSSQALNYIIKHLGTTQIDHVGTDEEGEPRKPSKAEP